MSYPSLTRVVQGFILYKSAIGLSPNTIRTYKTDLTRFAEWADDASIDTITSKQIETYLN